MKKNLMKNLRSYLGIAVAVILLATVPAGAQVYTELHNFDWHKEGANPLYPALLAQGQDGSLYGTLQTQLFGEGSVFNSSLSGTVTQIYGFTGDDGEFPQSGLSLGFDGNFYGTTEEGGTLRLGTVFKISPGGGMTVLHEFTGSADDGAYPWVPPIQTPDGNIYGATYNGTYPGIAYKIAPSGVFSVLTTLPSKTQAPFILGADGNLYGTTPYGGDFNLGTVFQLTTKGKLKIIHSFGSTDAQHPFGPVLQAADGKLYGTTPWGGTNGLGTVYVMSTSGAGYKVLHQFQALDGENPSSGMVQGSDKFLYSVATMGGSNGQGTLFKISTTGKTFSVLYNFDSQLGAEPTGTPTLHTNGTIYGVTYTGGPQFAGYGVLYSFTNNLKPFASLVVISSGKVGDSVGILGQGFSNATSVQFGSGPGTFTLVSDTYMIASPAENAMTGPVTVLEPGGNLVSTQTFSVLPTVLNFNPPSGTVGTQITINGTSLLQTTAVAFSGAKATSFTVNSDTQITVTVPAGAKTGKISVTTKGGKATSAKKFTVN
jgi:uncharacterized repeat protein (TIGR03803 family)